MSQTKGFISPLLSARHCVIKPGTDQILPDPIYKGIRQRRWRDVVVLGGFFDVATNDGAIGRCHTYTLIHTYECKWLYTQTHTLTCHTVGVNKGFQAVIEQRRHLQASVRSYIRAEKRSIWSWFTTLRWIIKAQGDLSCRVKLSAPCDHSVIMSCVLGSATCQPVVLHLTAAFHLRLWLFCSFSPTGFHAQAQMHQQQNPTENIPMFWPKVT